MALFKYSGFDKEGRTINGVMAADNEASLEEKLRKAGSWLLKAEQDAGVARQKLTASGKRSLGLFGKVSRRDLIEFCTLMGFQTREGVALIPALDTATQECENP